MAVENVPHPSFFALAIVLLKLKPRNTTVEEFILALRRSLPTTCDNTNPLLPAGLNTALLWQHLFESKVEEVRQKDSALIALETRLHDLQADTRVQHGGRKRNKDATTSYYGEDEMVKRLKLMAPAIFGLDNMEESTNTVTDSTRMLRIILRLSQLLRSPNRVGLDDEVAIRLIQQACLTIIETFPLSKLELEASRDAKAEIGFQLGFEEYFQGVRSVWILTIEYVRQNVLKDDDLEDLQKITPAMVSVIHFLIQKLYHCCNVEAGHRLEGLKKSRKRTNTKSSVLEASQRIEVFSRNSEGISTLLALMLASARSLQSSHSCLFDGLVCPFIYHLGASMSTQLFRRAGSHGIPDGSNLTCGDVRPKSEETLLATKLEAPYLVRVLHGLMKSQPRHIIQSSNPSSVEQHSADTFSANLLEKLQNTLLQGLFGRDDSRFTNALEWTQPHIPETSADAYIETPTVNGNDWFLSEIWDVLGWDILLSL